MMVVISFNLWLLLLLVIIRPIFTFPSTENIALPLLEEQTIGSEVHDFMDDVPINGREGMFFKLVNQYLKLGDDIVNDNTKWVALDGRSGVLRVATPVDREKYCNVDPSKQCAVHVKVVRHPQQVMQLFAVTLNVIDINDHAPVFPVSPLIVVNVSEDAPVTSRINLDRYLASDADVGANSVIYYSLSRSDHFSVHSFNDPSSGDPHLQLVITDELDYEQTPVYDLTLTATDRGSPQQQSSSVTLRVKITDANDNPPIFEKQLYRIELKENLKPGLVVTRVHAEDADDQMFGEVRYFVPTKGNSKAAQELVDVDLITGEVRLTKDLDREKHNNLRIVIAARDMAPRNHQKIGKTTLLVEVEDENDNPPSIQVDVLVDSNESVAYVSESSLINTYIAQVTARDADEGKNGEVDVDITTYPVFNQPLQHAPAHPNLQIGESYFQLVNDGFIRTRKILDREDIPQFLIVIHACDKGLPSLCASKNLTVIILDENDNPPMFVSSPKSIVLGEDTDFGTIVVQVKATDRDSNNQPSLSLTKNNSIGDSPNGVIRYTLHGGGNCFVIDQVDGKIKLVRKLDYESKKSWKMRVTAWDMGSPRRSANLSVSVDVRDINDNSPIFTTPNKFNQSVAATIQSDDVILKINAIDADEGDHSKVFYTIISEDGRKRSPHLFILDKRNGNLRLNMSNPHLENVVGSHILRIKAQDSGTPPLYDVTLLHVEVYDVPLSVLPTFTRTVEEIANEDKDLTVVLIASLSSAAFILLLILFAVIFKCKRVRKEVHTYDCRSAGDSAWKVNNKHQPTGGATGLLATQQSSFSSLNWSKDLKVNNDVISASFRARPTSRLSQKKGGTLNRNGNTPLSGQPDRDSGKGDSDHEIVYCEEDPQQVDGNASNNLHNPNTIVMMGGAAGVTCTPFCKDYGHGDSCWMPTAENNFYPPGEYNMIHYHHQHVQEEVYEESNFTASGLETISETQPLRTILEHSTNGGHDVYSPSNQSQVMYTSDVEYHSNHQHLQTPFQSNNYNLLVPPSMQFYAQQQYEVNVINPNYSVSERFHDGVPVVESSIATPPHSPSSFSNRMDSNSLMENSTQPQKEILRNQFLAAAGGISSLQEVPHKGPTTSPHYEAVSLEETQQIIEDIDRLIDE